jgi:hypothetical protein
MTLPAELQVGRRARGPARRACPVRVQGGRDRWLLTTESGLPAGYGKGPRTRVLPTRRSTGRLGPCQRAPGGLQGRRFATGVALVEKFRFRHHPSRRIDPQPGADAFRDHHQDFRDHHQEEDGPRRLLPALPSLDRTEGGRPLASGAPPVPALPPARRKRPGSAHPVGGAGRPRQRGRRVRSRGEARGGRPHRLEGRGLPGNSSGG